MLTNSLIMKSEKPQENLSICYRFEFDECMIDCYQYSNPIAPERSIMLFETHEDKFDFLEYGDAPGTVEIIEHSGQIIIGGITADQDLAIYLIGDKTPAHHIEDLIATDPTFEFQEGDCYELATELQDIDGVTGYASVVDSDTGDMVHVLAVYGDTLIDSLGFWDESDVEEFWDMKLDADGVSVHVEYNDLDGVDIGDALRSQTYHKLKELCTLVVE